MDARNTFSLFHHIRRKHLPAWFTGWWMRHIAGRYCPCEWHVKVRFLIQLCGWIDDEECRHHEIRFAAWYQPSAFNFTTSSAVNATIVYTQPPRPRHGV